MFHLLQSDSAAASRVVVVGSRGVIGKSLVTALQNVNVPTLPISSGDIDLLTESAAAKLADQLRPTDRLVMLSALTPDKGRDVDTLVKNLRMAQTVCSAIRSRPIDHVTYISSDAVYPFIANPVTEATAATPTDLYGAMHHTREIMFGELRDITDVAVLRCTMVLAEDDTHNSYGPNRFRRQALDNGEITLGGNGEETRDHVYVCDVAQLILDVICKRGIGILNIASGCSYSFFEVAELVAGSLDKKVKITTTDRQFPISHRRFDTATIRKNFPDFAFAALRDAIHNCHQNLGLLS